MLLRKKNGPVSMILTAVLLLILFVLIMVIIGNEPKAVVDSERLKINSLFYNVTKPLSEITDIRLSDEAPNDTRRTNGIGIGSVKRGWFKVEGMGKGRMYIHSDVKPYIYITTRDSFIIINWKDSKHTQEFYDELVKNWKP